jgi:hypothetical protein
MERRAFLRTAGALGAVGLAGCTGSEEAETVSSYSFDIDEELDFAYGEHKQREDEIEVRLEDTDEDRAKFEVKYNIEGIKEGLYASSTEFWMGKGEEVELTEKLVEGYNMAWEAPGVVAEELDTKEKLEEGPEQYMSLSDTSENGAEAYFSPEIFPTEDKHYE